MGRSVASCLLLPHLLPPPACDLRPPALRVNSERPRSAARSATGRRTKGYRHRDECQAGRGITKRAGGRSVIRGGALAVAGFLPPRRFASVLIAQVKMAAHAQKTLKTSFSSGVKPLLTRARREARRLRFKLPPWSPARVYFKRSVREFALIPRKK